MSLFSYIEERVRLATGFKPATVAVDNCSQLITASSFNYLADVTPADSTLPLGPCDGFYLSADANVVVRPALGAASITLDGLKGGSFVPVRCARIVSTTAGTIKAGWFQKPATAV